MDMTPPPQTKEHKWLQQMVGTWRFESVGPEMPTEDGSESEPMAGVEVAEPIGDYWVVMTGKASGGPIPGSKAVLTVGYDHEQGKFVGTWVGSPMTKLFVYDCTFDESENTLVMACDGPAWSGEGTTQYRDCMKVIDANTREFFSMYQDENGSWNEFMRLRFTRTE